VYIISKALVPTDGPDADFSNAKPKAKKGGADLRTNRPELFEAVVSDFCTTDRDPAMEILVAMYGWASSDAKYQRIASCIAAKASGDTLATLAIVLQPYKSPTSERYISDEELEQFKIAMYGVTPEEAKRVNFVNLATYTTNQNAKGIYESMCQGTLEVKVDFAAAAARVRAISSRISPKFAKLNAVKLLEDVYRGEAKQVAESLNAQWLSNSVAFAEAELRVMSALVLENSNGMYDANELNALYRSCTLDEPYMCRDQDMIRGSNLGFYYSTVYLIARSDALCYVPSSEGSNLNTVADDNTFININTSILKLLEPKRVASDLLLQAGPSRKF
jgi:hypothetical protein